MRRKDLFWGGGLMLVGALLLLSNLGLLPVNAWSLIWPLALILIGVWALMGSALGKGSMEQTQVSIGLDDKRRAEVSLLHAAGHLAVSALPAGSDRLVEGVCDGGVEQDVNFSGDGVAVKLRQPSRSWEFGPGPYRALDWTLRVNADAPLTLNVEGGASESRLDLTETQVKDLVVRTGASSVDVALPARAGEARVRIYSGAASVRLRLPQGVAGRFHISGALSSTQVDTTRFVGGGGYFETPGYDAAEQKVEAWIESGVGSVVIS